MRRRIRKFNSHLVLLVSVIGIQFLLLPFYHFHPDHQHSHSGVLPSHQHNAYFHSIELDSIAHLTHAHDHNSADHHSKNNDDETELKVDLNKVILKSKNSFKVLKVFSTFPSISILQKLKYLRPFNKTEWLLPPSISASTPRALSALLFRLS